MKIGFITSSYPAYLGDSHGNFIHHLALRVQKAGHKVIVVAPDVGADKRDSLEKIEIRRFSYFYPRRWQRLCGRNGMIDNLKEGLLVKLQVIPYLFACFISSLKLAREVDLLYVNWIIPNGFGACFAKLFWGKPYLNTIHSEEATLAWRYHVPWIFKFLVNRSNISITNSNGTKKLSLSLGCDEEKLIVIPFGVDTETFKPASSSRRGFRFQILTVGYLIERKGFDYLIGALPEILKENGNVALKIVGSGPREPILQRLMQRLGLENFVELLGPVSTDQLIELYRSSDLFVLPAIHDSTGLTEGLGVVLLEAMACHLPVIATRVGGIPDLIENNKTGLLVSEKDSSALASAILYLLKDQRTREQLAENGYQMVKDKFGWEKIAATYIHLFEEAGKESPNLKWVNQKSLSSS